MTTRGSRSHTTTTTTTTITATTTTTFTTVLTITLDTVITTAITTIVALATILTLTTILTTDPFQTTTATMPATRTTSAAPTPATKKPSYKPYPTRPLFTAFGLKPLRTHTLTPSQESCSICLVPFTDADPATKILRCTHVFHKTCLSTWLDAAKTSTCPMCRAELFVLPNKARREARNPRRDLESRRDGVWRVPRLRRESEDEAGRRDVVLRGMVGEGGEEGVVQGGFGTLARWRMEALGLGDGGMGMGVQEVVLDY